MTLRNLILRAAPALFFLASTTAALGAQPEPFMVKDINASAAGTTSSPGGFVTIGTVAYFSAYDGIHGSELWRTDGTEAGTFLLKDINQGADGSNPYNLTDVNGTLFFTAWDPDNGPALWKSDGTAVGTILVKSGVSAGRLKGVGGTLFVTAYDTATGWELWKSDGTEVGTVLLKDINPGIDGSNPYNLTDVNGTLFFTACDQTNGWELWKSDGTPEGTALVKDINPGPGGSGPGSLTAFNGVLFFMAWDSTGGTRLWKSDGTDAGTVPVMSGVYMQAPITVNGTLFFSNGSQLWKTDGTAEGTVLVKNIFGAQSFTDVDGTLFFTASDPAGGQELWKTDGTEAGTVQVKDIYPGPNGSNSYYLTAGNGTLFFTAYDPDNGYALWKSDGTDAGTVRVKAIPIDLRGDGTLAKVNGALLLVTSDPEHGQELWKSDGTAEGTVLLKDIFTGTGGADPFSLTDVNGTLFFQAHDPVNGNAIWKSDGTAAGTFLVKAIAIGAGDKMPEARLGSFSNSINVNGTLFFAAFERVTGSGLWKSDGTADGTTLVKGGIYPQSLVSVNGVLFFTASDGIAGEELWKSDGTEAGTVMVKDIYPGIGGSYPYALTQMNGSLFFMAYDATNGIALWKSDGTADGTVPLGSTGGYGEKILEGAPSAPLLSSNGTLFFVGTDKINGQELWKSDGTPEGTVIVKDINPGAEGSNPQLLADVNGTMFFVVYDTTNGFALWKSDGTPDGTIMVKPLQEISSAYSPTEVNGTLFFQTDDRTDGHLSLWKSDGTADGTVVVKSFPPFKREILKEEILKGRSNPTSISAGGRLYFVAGDQTSGQELWQSDGTAEGTLLVKDIFPGQAGSNPAFLTKVNGNLFFTAPDPVNGNELWGLDLTAPSSVVTAPAATEIITGADYAITGTATDTMSGVALVEVSTDGGKSWNPAGDTSGNGTWATWSFHWNVPTDGRFTVTSRATDKAGNVESEGAGVKVTCDRQKPTLAVTVPDRDVTVHDGKISIRGKATDTLTAVAVTVTADSAAYHPAVGPDGGFVQQLSFAEEGSHVITVTATDEGGNVTSVQRNVVNSRGTILIDKGAEYTATTAVTLDIDYYPSAAKMQFLANNASWSAPETFSRTKNLALPAGDGLKSVSVRFLDAGGNPSRVYSAAITLDTKPPVGSVTINGGAAATDRLDVTLTLAASDAGTVAKMLLLYNGTAWDENAWEDYKPLKSVILPPGYGVKKVSVKYRDAAGKVSAIYSDSIVYGAPGAVVSIGGYLTVTSTNAADPPGYATTTGVTLGVTNPSAYTQMCTSTNGTSWSAWESVKPARSIALPAGDGAKTVYVKFRAGAGGTESDIYSATIILDTKAPTGTVSINSGAYSTPSTTVNLTLAASDANGVTAMQFSTNGTTWGPWDNYAATRTVAVPAGDGVKKVQVRFRDAAGKVSAVCSATIILDTIPPVGTVKINAGAATATDPLVTLAVSATGGAVYMQVRQEGAEWSAWEPYAKTTKMTLTGTAGPKTVFARFRDVAGNVSLPCSDTIGFQPVQ